MEHKKVRRGSALRRIISEFHYLLLAIHSEKHTGKIKDCEICAESLQTERDAKLEFKAINQ